MNAALPAPTIEADDVPFANFVVPLSPASRFRRQSLVQCGMCEYEPDADCLCQQATERLIANALAIPSLPRGHGLSD